MPSPSKIRDKSHRGEKMRSTRFFKVQAQNILARADLTERDRQRLLEMNRATCAVFMKAQRDGLLDRIPRAKALPAKVLKRIEWHSAHIMKLAARV